MAEYVSVKNLGSRTYTEEFKGKTISIPAKGSIKMIRQEAVHFLGSVGNSNIEKGIEKNLEIIRGPVPVEVEEEKKFFSHLDGLEFKTQEELDAHLSSLNPESVGAEVLKDEEADTAAKRRKLMKG